MTEKIDPELRDDRNEVAPEDVPVDIPAYDATLFELPDDFEYREDGEYGDEDEE